MDQIGSLIASELKIETEIKSYPDCPNVITFHPTIDGYNNPNSNVLAIVDLSGQTFQTLNKSLLDSKWWLSFNLYCDECSKLLLEYLNNDNDNSKNNDVLNIIFEFIGGNPTKLTSEHHISDLFISSYYSTDTLITLNTPKPKESEFDFSSFSSNNPYANLSSNNPYANYSANTTSTTTNDDTYDDDDDDLDKEDHAIEFLQCNTNNNSLQKWFYYKFPKIEFPQTTSREKADTFYNEMLKHWELKLSSDRRFLLIIPEKLGEIADIYFSPSGQFFWIQSIFGNINPTKYENIHSQIFTLNQCDVTKGFKCKVIKLLLANEEPARFRIIKQKNDFLIWNFSKNGASDDIFTVISADENKENYNCSNPKLNNKLCRVENAQSFHDYRFKDGNLKDLIRDVPKLCSLNETAVIFGGACFLSVLDDLTKVHIYDGEEDEEGKELIYDDNIYSYYCYINVSISSSSESFSEWITDYIPFNNNNILGRWQGKMGKSMYGIWEYNNSKLQCIHTNTYDSDKWSNYVLGCYHFGERIKTIILAIELQKNFNK